MPPGTKDVRLERGESISAQSGPLTATKWKDHDRDVYMLSTLHDSSMASSGRQNRDREEVIKPASVLNYNQHKAGVDVADQLVAYHPFERRTLKWYKKLFFRSVSSTNI